MRNLNVLIITIIAAGLFSAQQAFGQATTLHNPLIPGASSQMPLIPAPTGALPPPGSGLTPARVTPGMTGTPTLLPSIPAIPSNNIDQSFSGIGLPISPAVALPPGTWGPLLTPFLPPSPSTPGPAPGMLKNINSTNPAELSAVQPAGGYPGTGGYYTTIPKIRRVGTQETAQYERRGHYSVLGGGGNSQDEVTLAGPLAGFGVPNGVPTGVNYNNGAAGSNIDNYNKSIDLGGGMRQKFGNVVLSNGKSVQDLNGLNALYGNSIPSLGATRATEFGQGAPLAYTSVGRNYSLSTDFGFPLTPQCPANSPLAEPNHSIPQTGVLTNF
jgi:hypothetical protein